MTVRVIPKLDIKGPNLVKGVQLEGLRALGEPRMFARRYYEAGADELVCIDAVASLYGRNNILAEIERIAREIFIPLTVGGGLRSIEDIRQALRAGADKVAINTAALAEPALISRAAEMFGSSTIVVSIHAKKFPDGDYYCLTDFGRETTGTRAVDWARRAVECGAGEILLVSVDRDGTGKGFDTALIDQVNRAVRVPVIASGGANTVQDMADMLAQCEIGAVALSSVLHYDAVHDPAFEKTVSAQEGNTQFITRGETMRSITPMSLADVKHGIAGAGIPIRPAEA